MKPGSDHTCNSFMEGDVHERLSKRYPEVLVLAKQYVSRKRKKIRPGGGMSASRKQWLLEQESDCPMCGVKFNAKNLDTEHIHSRALGGLKSSNENRIPMCVPCNQAKGFVMQRLLPKPKDRYRSEYWGRVEAFLLWSELTTDEGLHAGVVIPIVHEYFLEARSSCELPPISLPSRAFSRLSSWIVGDVPNYGSNKQLSSTRIGASRNEEREKTSPKV